MDLDLDVHAGWARRVDAPNATPLVPRRCAIAGNPGGNYSNVSKLPSMLWRHFGLDVAEHWTTATEAGTAVTVDVVVILADLGGGPIMEGRSRRPGEVRVSSQGTWARVREALIGANQPQMSGDDVYEAPRRKARTAAADPIVTEGPPVRRTPDDPLEPLREAVRLLVEQAQAAGLASIEVAWTADQSPTVSISRFVVDRLEVK